MEQESRKECDNINEDDGSKVEQVEIRKVDEPDNNETEPKDEEDETQSLVKDPRYERYFKMMHFGVPKQAVKIKMELEGLDSSILERV